MVGRVWQVGAPLGIRTLDADYPVNSLTFVWEGLAARAGEKQGRHPLTWPEKLTIVLNDGIHR